MLDAIRSRMLPRYEEPHRAYHGLAHVQALLQAQAAHGNLIRDPLAVTLAIWFHDAIYDTRRQDNEDQSAELAQHTLTELGAGPGLIASVVSKVKATHRHEWTDGDPDTALFLDLDLGILASSPQAYDRYAAQIAKEYDWVPVPAYKQGRAKVLQAFVDRPQIYFTPALRALWEDAARANMRRELAGLMGT